MATNYLQPGEVIDYTPSGSPVSSGDVVVIGTRIGVALTDIAVGEPGSVQTEGVFRLPKTAGVGEAIAQGVDVYWDGAVITASDGAGANTPAGYVFAAAGDNDATVAVKLIG